MYIYSVDRSKIFFLTIPLNQMKNNQKGYLYAVVFKLYPKSHKNIFLDSLDDQKNNKLIH